MLHCLELNRVQIEGQAFVRYPGYYRVEWRFMLQSYALHNPTFTTRVLGPKEERQLPTVYDSNFYASPDERNSESLFKWEWQAGEFQPQRGPDQALPVGDFFEVIVGKIRVKEENSTVFFSMLEKYVSVSEQRSCNPLIAFLFLQWFGLEVRLLFRLCCIDSYHEAAV